MAVWFDFEGFKNYYLAKSKYAKKTKIVKDFEDVWSKEFRTPIAEITRIGAVRNWNNNQQLINDRLLGKGHSIASVNGFLKMFVDWNNLG